MGSSGQEEAPGIFWAWVEGASGNMALALAALVEQVLSWAQGVGLGGLTLQPNMDTLGTLLVGWMIFVTLILILGTFFYFKFIHQLGNDSTAEQDDTRPGEEGQGRVSKGKGGTGTAGSATPGKSKAARKEVARKPTIVPDHKLEPVSAPVATGADPDAVKWTNNVFTWLYNSADGGQIVRKIWLETVNENTVKTAIETGILVEVVELMKQTPPPVLSNMVVDCSPTDNVTITCDCDATLYLRIITTRTQGDQTTESEYACAVTPLHGRLNIAAVTAELLAVAKFDGWPEVSLKLEGIRNNAAGLNEQQMLDVIDEVLTSALRNSVLEFNFQSNKTFPRFRRSRQVPDPIMPVGYDSMVREKQTHPPSVPRKTPKAEFVPLHNEKIEAAGESFTALTFSSTLTSSEEQLIARNLTKYPSLENAEMGPEEIEEFCKTWQENYVPATDVPPPTENLPEEKPPLNVVDTQPEQECEPKTQNFVLMVSNRSKLIDEPRNSLPIPDDDDMDGEDAELENIIPQQRPADEPCLRKETGSPLLLTTPKFSSLAEAEDGDLEDAKLRFDRLEIIEKPQVTSTPGLGPLHKGSFVSEACCVGVLVGVPAQVPQLDFRIETAALGGSVACNLPEYDQEASTPSPLLPLLHNQPSSATTLCLESGVDVDDLLSGSEEQPSSPFSIQSLFPEPFIPAASDVSNLIDDRSGNSDVEERERIVLAGQGDSSPTPQSSGIVACTELGSGSIPNRKDSEESVSEDEDQYYCSEIVVQCQNIEYSPEKDEVKTCPLDTCDVQYQQSKGDPEHNECESMHEDDSSQCLIDYSAVSEEQVHECESEVEIEASLIAKKDKNNVTSITTNEKDESREIKIMEKDYEDESKEIGIMEEEDEDEIKEVSSLVKEEDENEAEGSGTMKQDGNERERADIVGQEKDEYESKEASMRKDEDGNGAAIIMEQENKCEAQEVCIMEQKDEDDNENASIVEQEEDEYENEEVCSIEKEGEDENKGGCIKEQEDKDESEEAGLMAKEKDEHESRELDMITEEEEESKLKKMCLNKFTESLYRHIEIEDSELSIPEECVENLPWEVTDVYEPQSSPASLPCALGKDGNSDDSENSQEPESPPPSPQKSEPRPPAPQESESPVLPIEKVTEDEGAELEEQHDTEPVTCEEELVLHEQCDRLEPEAQDCDNGDYMICSEENENFMAYYSSEQGTNNKKDLFSHEILECDFLCRLEEDIQVEGEKSEEFKKDLDERFHALAASVSDSSQMHNHAKSSQVIVDENGNGIRIQAEPEVNDVITTDNLDYDVMNNETGCVGGNNDDSSGISTEVESDAGSNEVSTEIELDSNVTSIKTEADQCICIVSTKTEVSNDKPSIEFDEDTNKVDSTEVKVPNEDSSEINTEVELSRNGVGTKTELYNDINTDSTDVETPDKNRSEINRKTEFNRDGVSSRTDHDKDTNVISSKVEVPGKDSNGIGTKTDLNGVYVKTKFYENANIVTDTEFNNGINESNIKPLLAKDAISNRVNTERELFPPLSIDILPPPEQEQDEDEAGNTNVTALRHSHLGAFLPSDSEVEMRTSISSLESLNTQLQEALKNKYYFSLKYPSSFSGEDSTTDANTDDEYVDSCTLARDPFSPEEEDFTLSGEEELGYTSHGAEDSTTDSEVEGIIGKHIDEEAGGLHSKQQWRKSDISLIIKAEAIEKADECWQLQATPTPLQNYNTESSQENGEYSINNTSPEIVLTSAQYEILNASQKGGQTSHQESPQPSSQQSGNSVGNSSHENIQETGTSFRLEHREGSTEHLRKQEHSSTSVKHLDSGGKKNSSKFTGGGTLLTTAPCSLAPLTQTDNTGALTQPQVTSLTGIRVTGGGVAPGHTPFTAGLPQWTRPLPSYPVYGTYFVTTTTHSTTSQPMGIPGLNGKRLLVKIVKATGVGCEKSVAEAYSVVEMDEPPQKFTTSVVKDTNSPFWDEQFLFDLSGGTLELLFELYDKASNNFLGLGIVGIEELVATPSQRQIIPLQSRPYENDEVSGSLTVEFLFLDRADLPEHTLRASTTSQSVTPRGDVITTTTTTYIKAPENQDIIVNGGDSVAAVVLRDIEEKKSAVTNNASKSTMIIHASKKPDLDGQHGYMTDDLLNFTVTAITTTATPTITTTGAHTAASTTTTSTTTTTTHSAPATTTADTSELVENEERGRSRGSRRKRDSFFGTLKKRFSRSKVRSKSMDPGMRDPSLERDPSVGRSVSMERSSTLNRASGLLSVPPSAGGDAGSTRSSLSDASAISSSSTRTYVNEASTLIIETSENGVFKHYLIPLSLQQKSKWRKKGLKLHIFGEHTFVAKHMSSSTPCEVCQKTLGRRFGKQGYVCRDCGYKCHKPCHVKTETTCPNSTVNNMDLEYVRDPREERRAWLKKTNKTA